MTRAYLVLAVALFLVTATVGWAQESSDSAATAVAAPTVASAGEASPAPMPAGSGETDADQVALPARPADDAAPAPQAPVANAQTEAPHEAGPIMAEVAAPACAAGGCQSCGNHFWQWLTYRPLERPCLCGCCCHQCAPCCDPPLYTFFLCNACGQGLPCYAASGVSGGCCGTGHCCCLVHLWERLNGLPSNP